MQLREARDEKPSRPRRFPSPDVQGHSRPLTENSFARSRYAVGMAKKITLTLPPINVVNTDHVFEIREGDVLQGRLKISKGGLDWYKKNARKASGRASWAQLKEWMEGT